jgi:hypothetical protein
MSRFYMTSENSRGNPVTAAGRNSGQRAHLRGWRNGVEVIGHPDDTHPDRDTFDIYATAGSSHDRRSIYIGTVTLNDNGQPTYTPA